MMVANEHVACYGTGAGGAGGADPDGHVFAATLAFLVLTLYCVGFPLSVFVHLRKALQRERRQKENGGGNAASTARAAAATAAIISMMMK